MGKTLSETEYIGMCRREVLDALPAQPRQGERRARLQRPLYAHGAGVVSTCAASHSSAYGLTTDIL